MIFKRILFVVCAYLTTSEAAIVDNFNRCSIKDQICLNNQMQDILKDLSNNGVKDQSVAPLDPLELKNINFPMDLVNITITEAILRGLKDITVTGFEAQIEKGITTMEINCDVDIKGKHKVKGSGPVLQNLFGSDSIHGDGNFNLILNNVHVKLNYNYHLEKNAKGDVFFKIHKEECRFEYEVGNLHLSADNIYLGKIDASKIIVDYINQNWKYLVKTYGKYFFDVFTSFFIDIMKDLSNLPATYYFIEDLTSFARND